VGGPLAQRPVWPVLVVVVAEAVEQRLQLPDGGRSGLAVEPFLQGLVEAFDFPAGLSARGFVTPQPHKRPKSSYQRFCADAPNERWQLDINTAGAELVPCRCSR
jgi:hypothetical protein